MGFKDKMTQYFSEAYIQKYGDRMNSVMGSVLSIHVEEKSVLGIYNKILATFVVKPDMGKGIQKCQYKKAKWFKKPEFIEVKQGHRVVVMGIMGEKGKDESDVMQASNIANLSTKKDLLPFDHSQIKKARQQAVKMRR